MSPAGRPLLGLRLSPGLKDGDHVGLRLDAKDFGNALERLRPAPGDAAFDALESSEGDSDEGSDLSAPEAQGQADQLSGGGWFG